MDSIIILLVHRYIQVLWTFDEFKFFITENKLCKALVGCFFAVIHISDLAFVHLQCKKCNASMPPGTPLLWAWQSLL